MAGSKNSRFACPSCGRRYSWKRELAGKKVRCKCRKSMRVPEALPAEDGTYELDGSAVADGAARGDAKRESGAPTDSPRSGAAGASTDGGAGRCPSCGSDLSTDAVICIQCGFDISIGKQIKTTVTEGEPDSSAAKASGNGLFGKIKRALRLGQKKTDQTSGE